jgi:hypothetical protein
MKTSSFLITLFIVLGSLQSKAQDVFTVWPALGEFHAVMSTTFHAAEKGKFDPVKQRSGEMVDKADALQKSSIPEQHNKPQMKVALSDLHKKATDLNELIMNNAKDEKINKSLIQVHDSFHKIVGLCNENVAK